MAQSAARVPAWPSSACSDKASRSQSSRLKREQEWARDWTRERLCRWPSGKLWSSSSEPVSATQEDQTWVQNEKDWKDELGLEQLLTVLVLVSPGSASHRPHRTPVSRPSSKCLVLNSSAEAQSCPRDSTVSCRISVLGFHVPPCSWLFIYTS